jgi:16S rRNA (guanine966-N2)-methyltransferase
MSKPRIIAGSAKGRVLEVPKHGTRPSPSMLRQALFNILESRRHISKATNTLEVSGMSPLEFRECGIFLDLFSGSGAIGLEAASRDWEAICIELNRDAAQVIRRNAEKLKLNVKVIQGDALKYIKTAPKVDVAFAAPPYPMDLAKVFQSILEAKIVSASGLYIFQHPKELEVSLDAEKRIYGSNALSFIKVNSESSG